MARISERTGVNARDRIGTGPWYNAKGILIATNLSNLHSNNNIKTDMIY